MDEVTANPDLNVSVESACDALTPSSWTDKSLNLSTQALAGSDMSACANSTVADEDSEDELTPTPSIVADQSTPNAEVMSNGTASPGLHNGVDDQRSSHESRSSRRKNEEEESPPPTDTTQNAAASDSGSETDLEDNAITEDEEDADEEPPGTWDERFRLKKRNLDAELPETVTKLRTVDGSKVYLVGTAHFSMESQEDVAKTIEATQPDVVLVELCRGRANILQLDEETILEEAKNLSFSKVQLTIRQNGLVQGLMYLFLLNMSAHLTKQLGMAPGGEFRRAFAEAMKVPGCVVRLGDRPIQITLQRALSMLSLWQKLCLAWCMLTSRDPISKEEVERCKQRDLLDEMLNEMTGKFPVLSQVFVKERDIYLAHSLQLASTCIPCLHTKSGSVPAVVVGVVGIGHVSGIVEHWEKVSAEDIPPLLIIPETSLSTKVVKWTMKASVVSGVFYCCYKLLARPAISNLVSKVTKSILK